MKKKKNRLGRRYRAIALALCTVTLSVHAFAPINFFAPYDTNLRMPAIKDKAFPIGMNMEYGQSHHGKNWDGYRANILQLHNATESVIPMLIDPIPGLLVSNPATATLINNWALLEESPSDDGTRGHIQFTGEFSQFDTTLWGGYKIPWDLGAGSFSINAYLPLRKIDIKNVSFIDQTASVTTADLQVHQDVTNNLASNLVAFGNLDIGSTSISGIGDLVTTLNWHNRYIQDKEDLKAVNLFAKIGLSIPTAQQKKVDRAFSVPLGNDGAWGMPIGIGIGLEYSYNIQIGADVDFLVLFDKTKTRRLKTEEHQTDFFLLNKGQATKDHGLTWKFNLYAQEYRCWRGLSVKTAYEYIKHDDDRLIAKSDDFSYQIINTAQSLKEWNTHAVLFSLNYDFIHECKKANIIPQMSIFYKLPVAGKGVINPGTFGGQCALNF
ncbi:MAG: hypothetical protein WCT20_03375 [Candidatus Babeliales bacterium]